MFVQSLVQYNNQARVWAANARFGWLNTAGTGLFVVFNEGQEADGFFRWLRPQARSLVVKYTRQFGTGGRAYSGSDSTASRSQHGGCSY